MLSKIIQILIVVGVLFLLRLIFKAIKKKNNGIHIIFLNNLLFVGIIIIAIYKIFLSDLISAEMNQLLVKGGTIIVAIATLAAQKTLSNVISGFSISASRPYDIGQKIQVVSPNGNKIAEGVVKTITLRHTIIKQYDGKDNIIPNSIMDTSVVVNANYTDFVGNYLDVTIDYDSNVENAKEIFLEVVTAAPGVVKDRIEGINVRRLVSNGITLRTTVWTENIDDNYKACSYIREQILEKFKENNITISI